MGHKATSSSRRRLLRSPPRSDPWFLPLRLDAVRFTLFYDPFRLSSVTRLIDVSALSLPLMYVGHRTAEPYALRRWAAFGIQLPNKKKQQLCVVVVVFFDTRRRCLVILGDAMIIVHACRLTIGIMNFC